MPRKAKVNKQNPDSLVGRVINLTSSERLDRIMAFECGEISDRGTLELFSDLISGGMAWTLQGTYGRGARSLIDSGFIDSTGQILREAL